MIQVSRAIIRQFRTIFKKSVGLGCMKGCHPPVVMKADANGLTIHSQHEGLAVAVHVDGLLPAEQIVVPARALEEFEGREQNNVELEHTASSKVLARWSDRGVPCAVEYELTNTDTPSSLPELAGNFTQNEATLLKAIDDAMNTVANDAAKFATNKIQLRGQKGEIVATDGRQLLWQTGFQFPWTDDVLLPRIKAFACSELSGSVAIGKTATHVCIRAGGWTFYLPIDKEGRFPKVENVIPTKASTTTHLQLDEKDVTFLAKTLPRLPGDENTQSPVTLDLNGQVVVRARAEEQTRATEAILSRSQATGQTLRYPMNRNHLSRALDLGFKEIHFASVDRPLLCEDQSRKFVFLGLGQEAALAPTDNDLRLASDAEAAPNPKPQTERTTRIMKPTRQIAEPTASSNGNGQHANGEQTENGQHKSGTFASLLEEAQSVQNILRDALLRTNQLLGGLKQYRRQAKAMNSTLASLRQLQEVEA